MLDIDYIRENADVVKKAVRDKQLEETIDIDQLLKIDEKRRDLITKVDKLRAERNELSDKVPQANSEDERNKLIEKAKEVKEELQDLEEDLKEVMNKYNEMMLWVPNVPAEDVPYGEDEEGNKVVRREGEKPELGFKPKDHLDLGKELDLIDTERGVKIGGFRSYFLKNEGMLLEQAILQYALDYMIEQGFTPMTVPLMVNKEALVGTGYFPWGEDDHYYTQDDQGLIGTSEVSLTSYHSEEVLDKEDLPIMMTGLSPCFRREVGSHGRDTRGVFRVHSFNKVEQVVILPQGEELSREWHEKMLGFAEQVLKDLGLHYQVLLMCTGDMGAGQRKKYDIETWFPAQEKYRETHSDSYFLDFQSRRLNMKYRGKNGELKYVYTLNNTVAATPRLLAAVLENYQQEDGSVVVPEVLRDYVGKDVIKPEK